MATRDMDYKDVMWLTLARLIEFVAIPGAILAALGYVAGWLYKLNFFAAFGIQHELLTFAPEYYLTASWTSFFLGIALLLAGAAWSICAIAYRSKAGDSVEPKAVVRHTLYRAAQAAICLIPAILVWVFVLTPPWFPSAGVTSVIARIQQSKDLCLGIALMGVTFVAGVWLSSRHFGSESSKPEDALTEVSHTRSVPFWLLSLLLLVAYLATFLLMAGWLGQYHGAGAVLDTKVMLPEVVLYSSVDHPLAIRDGTLVELPVGAPSAAKVFPVYRYQGLRLILFHGGVYYVFRPTEVSRGQPVVYTVGEESILYLELRPRLVGVPVY